MWDDPNETSEALRAEGYLPDARTATSFFLAQHLEKPLLVEGPAGAGKTSLAVAIARATGAELIRLQCYDGIDESRALYEWEYGKQLLYTQLLKEHLAPIIGAHDNVDDAVAALADEASAFYSEAFLLPRPLLRALTHEGPRVLLIDEIDKADPEFEAYLLEVLGEFQVSIPELGTIVATSKPIVLLTSNATRELSDPLRRRCLHLLLELPSSEREREILRHAVPNLDERLNASIVRAVDALRELELRRAPSLAEVIDWARAVLLLGKGVVDEVLLRDTLGLLLKHPLDLEEGLANTAKVTRAAQT